MHSHRPLLRKDFNRAVDRRRDPRLDAPFELIFRDIPREANLTPPEKSAAGQN